MAYLRAQEGSPNDEIAIGLVGCGGMGNGNMSNFLNIKGVRVVAVCDVDSKQMAGSEKTVSCLSQTLKARTGRHRSGSWHWLPWTPVERLNGTRKLRRSSVMTNRPSISA
jgi:hypothetical protein